MLPSLPPMPTQPPLHEPNRSTLLQLGTLIGFAIISHFSIALPIVAGFALLVYVLKMATIYRGKVAPPRWVMMLLTVFSIGLILFFYGGWNGQTAGISFLVLLVSLKFLESRLLRDYYVVCLILYFLAASAFLFSSSMLSIVSVLFYTIAITAILFKISNPSDMRWTESLKASSIIIAKAIPLAILLFFFFPRISGNFGILPSQDESQRLSALDNNLVAGDLATGAFDTTLAFRAEFNGVIPPRSQLYWRSKVMPIEKNFSWEVIGAELRNTENIQRKRAASSQNTGDVEYQILHEKSSDFFLPYLDYVAGYSKGQILDDYSVFVKTAAAGSFSYMGSSTFIPSLPKIEDGNLAALKKTDSKPTARLLALLEQIKNQSGSDAERVDNLFRYFVRNGFSYSLSPPSLNSVTPLDDFMFVTRTGYCEHFASAFTTMLRWLEVPSRVVVGYQGGKLNQAGGYVEVRYSDAHAWSEVWLDGSWRRVDPTAAVSPERIEHGMEALVELWDGYSINGNASGRTLSNFLNPTGGKKLWRSITDSWGNLGYQWNKWVVNYDMQAQRELLSNLGFDPRNSLTTLIAIMASGALSILLFYFWQLIPKAIKRGEAQRAYLQFVVNFRKHDVRRKVSDSPREFALRANQKFPHLADEIDNITRTYEQLRYGRRCEDMDDALRMFKQQVKRFKLSKQT
ncbi:MAG: transglutaminase-like putative cysteine protease [Pseudoalteromonas tetraodonis]|jgi:transglutaminase-like putative cysteine protease